MEKTLAELFLWHLERCEEMEGNLLMGCQSAVLKKLRISAAMDSPLIASALTNQCDSELYQLVDAGSPGLAQKLSDFRNPYGIAWKEPACE